MKSVYLSGPVTGHIEEMEPVFNHVETVLNEKGFATWNPMRNIPHHYTWQQSMDICVKSLNPDDIGLLLVIQYKDYTNRSKGVRAEIDQAETLNIPIRIIPFDEFDNSDFNEITEVLNKQSF